MKRTAVIVCGVVLAVALFFVISRSTGSRADHPDTTVGTGQSRAEERPESASGSSPSEVPETPPNTVPVLPASQQNPNLVFSGPGDIEDWTLAGDSEAWSQEGGSFVSNGKTGIVAREFSLPSRSKIGLEVSWDSVPRFRILLRSDDGTAAGPGNAYDLIVRPKFVSLRKRWNDGRSGGSQIIGKASIEELSKGDTARLEIYVDQVEGRFGIELNGQPVPMTMARRAGEEEQEVGSRDRDPGTGEFGNWLQFFSEEPYPVRVSDMSIERWDGELPKVEPGASPAEP